MSSPVGDKIVLNAPTLSGSNNVWGSETNALWEIMDELLYAVQEDRNMTITGGGKISFVGGYVTFTEDIHIHNHITGYKNVITTAASNFLMSTPGVSRYVALTRKPAVDATKTSFTAVADGALPKGTTEATIGTFVFAYLTADGTVMLPWAGKELLPGDHWNIGTHQTWFERLASRAKPSFRSVPADTSQIVIPASATNPACVFINGKLYANTGNLTLDIDTAGRNGLDTGSKAAATIYYLSAIPPASGRGFDAVLSATVPATGPTGFASRSYIGSLATQAGASTIIPFSSAGGRYHVWTDFVDQQFSSTSDTAKHALTIRHPVTVKTSLGAVVTVSMTIGTACEIGPGSVGQAYTSRVDYNGEDNHQVAIPIDTYNTVYVSKGTAVSGNLYWRVYGWIEDPMEYA